MNNAIKLGVIIGAGVVAIAVVMIIINSNNASEDDSAAMIDERVEVESASNQIMTEEDGVMTESGSEEQMPGDLTEEGSEDIMDDEMMVEDESAGVYTAYSETLLQNAADGDVVLFFKASWCPTCVALDKDIKERSADIPADVTILEIDYDDAMELRKKYGVTIQHTLVQVDATGEMITKWVGSPDLEALLTQIQ